MNNVNRQSTHLTAALELAQAGWNVFPLRQGTKTPAIGKKQGGRGAHDGTTDAAQIRKWWVANPSRGIGANLGTDRIAIDIDLNHGGEFLKSFPATRMHYSGRGNGNAHLIYRYAPGSMTARMKSGTDVLGLGIDIRIGEGSYIVMPPTTHEATGQPYSVGPENNGVEHVLTDDELVAIWAESGREMPRHLTEAPKTARRGGLRAVPAGASSKLQDLLDNPPSEGGRNDWLSRVSGHYARQFVGQVEQYQAAVEAANGLMTEPLPDVEVTKTSTKIWETHEEGIQDDKATDKKTPESTEIYEHINLAYDIVFSRDEAAYAVPKSGVRLPVTIDTDDFVHTVRFGVFESNGHYRIPPELAVKDALAMVVMRARMNPTVRDVYMRSAYRNGQIILDLAQKGNTQCVVVTRDGWELRPEPPQGVLFRRTKNVRALPTPATNGNADELRAQIGWDADSDQWKLARGWLAASLFANIPRPFLAMYGNAGSAKSTRARALINVIDPREQLGGAFGNKSQDNQVSVMSRYIVAWDNLDRISETNSDFFCRVVTGDQAEYRKLYTDTGVVTMDYMRTGIITAIVPPNFKPDAVERLVPLYCAPISDTERRSEITIKQRLEDAHPQSLGAVLDDVVTILQNLDQAQARHTERPRMSDFYDLLWALDPTTAETYLAKVGTTLSEVAEDDPFVQVVVAWLEARPADAPQNMMVADIWKQAERYRPEDANRYNDPHWPGNAANFSRWLTRKAGPLKSMGWEVSRGARTKRGQTMDIRNLNTLAIEFNDAENAQEN